VKEFLSARGVDHVSVDITQDDGALARLTAAGLRGVPAVSRGDRFIHAVGLDDVAEFIGQAYDARPVLSAAELVRRYRTVLDTAVRLTAQIPTERLDDRIPGRDRTYLTLANHTIQIAADCLSATEGLPLVGARAESIPDPPDPINRLEARVDELGTRLEAWLAGTTADELERPITTFYGEKTLHQVLERAVWHSAQHTRQLAAVVELVGLRPDRPLGDADLADLPLPRQVWEG
jgi:hypothetical protein